MASAGSPKISAITLSGFVALFLSGNDFPLGSRHAAEHLRYFQSHCAAHQWRNRVSYLAKLIRSGPSKPYVVGKRLEPSSLTYSQCAFLGGMDIRAPMQVTLSENRTAQTVLPEPAISLCVIAAELFASLRAKVQTEYRANFRPAGYAEGVQY